MHETKLFDLLSRNGGAAALNRSLTVQDPPGAVSNATGNLLGKIAAVYTPSFDIKETIENYILMADLPGLGDDDLDVEVCDGCLTIAGERVPDDLEDGTYFYALDRHFGTFCLAFQLPQGVAGDRVKANMDNGVLTVQVPKAPCVERGPVSRVLVARGH